MPLEPIAIHSKFRDYSVNFGAALIADEPRALFAVDENVWRLHRDGWLAPLKDKEVITVRIGEEYKTLEGVGSLYDRLIERAPKKNTTLVAIGGGILQDVAGFAASTLYRGIGWRFVPTTMLAQCDSCIGAKTSLNYKGFKNLLGTFYPPVSVEVQPLFLSTQSEADYLSGVGELVKLHLIGGEKATAGLAAQYSQLLQRDAAVTPGLIRDSLLIKKMFIEEDELDAGRRNLLNFGHCFGHAWETATDYAVPHGQAVAAGIILAQRVAVRRGLMTKGQAARLNDTFLKPLLKGFSWQVDSERIIEAMRKDKKTNGAGFALVMMKEAHEMVRVDDLTDKEAREALETL